MRLQQKLQKVDQRKAVLYTLSDGAVPLCVMNLYCPGMSPYAIIEGI